MSEFQTLTDVADLKYLRDLYRKHLPETSVGYHTLNNYVRWFELNPKIDHVQVNVFHNWKETGFFLILDYYHVLINSLYMCDDDLKCALKLLDWTRAYKIYALPEPLYCTVEEILLNDLYVNFKSTPLKVFEKDITTFEAIDVIRLPDYLESRPLSIADAKLVNDEFYLQQEGSLEYIQSLIRYNLTIGLYNKENNELIAWCTRCQCGFMNILHVRNKARGRGLATLMIQLYAEKMQELGEDVRTMIHDSITSDSLMIIRKLGSGYMEDVFIIYTLKKIHMATVV